MRKVHLNDRLAHCQNIATGSNINVQLGDISVRQHYKGVKSRHHPVRDRIKDVDNNVHLHNQYIKIKFIKYYYKCDFRATSQHDQTCYMLKGGVKPILGICYLSIDNTVFYTYLYLYSIHIQIHLYFVTVIINQMMLACVCVFCMHFPCRSWSIVNH